MEVLDVFKQKQVIKKVKIKHIWLSSIDILGSKTQQVETFPRSKLSEQVSEVRKIQNGDTRKHTTLLANR